jgi:hypothetical protein
MPTFTYMSIARGDWGRCNYANVAEWVEGFAAWAAKASLPDEHAHVANEASYLLSLNGMGKYADTLAPLTRA